MWFSSLALSEVWNMSDLASQLALTRTPTHLPLSWYFDPKVAEIEQKTLFDRGPGYVGHAAMVAADFQSPRQTDRLCSTDI